MRKICFALALAFTAALSATASNAAEPPSCAVLDKVFPQPGRSGGGENAWRPLPVFAPMRSQPGAPGTLSLSIAVDHVSPADGPGDPGYPGYVYVGNYPVNDIPVFRETVGANTSLQVINPEDGKSYGISNLCLNGPTWGYGGSQWSLVQADTLDVMLQSHLDYTGSASVGAPVNGGVPCRASNLHTHGLLVSPYHPKRAGTGPYGDYVLDVTQPRGSLDFGTDVDDCGTQLGQFEHRGHGLTDLPLHYSDFIPGEPGVNSMDSGQHPSGLFWYHPHPHGYSRDQIQGGTTGAITIGALTDYACPDGDGTPGNCTITNANIRVMVLKDAQLINNGDGTWGTVYLPESPYCNPTGGVRLGECEGTPGPNGPGKWVFSVNGVQYPHARIPAGKTEIWRIVNASQDVSYNLSIRKLGDGGQTELPYQLLARDGVAITQTERHKIMHTQMLLMPATRVEIAIPAPADGGTYILHNDVAQTGGNGHGDTWPAIDLASFTWAKPDANSVPTPPRDETVTGPKATLIPQVQEVVNGLRGVCTFEPGDKRLIYFTHRFVTVLGDDKSGKSGLLPQQHEVFGLIAGVQHKNGSIDFYSDKNDPPLHTIQEVWNKGIHDGDPAFPAFDHNPWGTICTVKGNVEPWLLTNYTGENHNFHIHQSKFSIDPNGVFQYPLASVPMTPSLRHTDAEVKSYSDPALTAYVDTIPMPRGQTFCASDPTIKGCHNKTTGECSGSPTDPACQRPGIISLVVGFLRAEQVGTYVYHCHIMEHEDGGMMAMLRVLCPKGDASCASQEAQQAICRPPAD